MIKVNDKGFINAKDIYTYIGVKSRFNDWITNALIYIDAKEDENFYYFLGKSTGGRPAKHVMVTSDIGKELCLISRSEKAKELRLWLIAIDKKHETGLAFTAEQITALMDLSKSMMLVSIQKHVEKKHFELFNKPSEWWKYRADLLGYSKETLIQAMIKVNKYHKSTKESLMKLDSNELIRTGVIDFFMALGKTQEYATNAGNLCKEMAEKMDLGVNIFDDTKPNPLKINKSLINNCNNSFKSLKQ